MRLELRGRARELAARLVELGLAGAGDRCQEPDPGVVAQHIELAEQRLGRVGRRACVGALEDEVGRGQGGKPVERDRGVRDPVAGHVGQE